MTPIDLSTMAGLEGDEGNALAGEASAIRSELQLLRTPPAGTPKEDVREYRKFLKARLRAIRLAQKALCQTCLGTGRYEDIHLTYRVCPTCNRLNPDHNGNY